jgi:hypothetical protein
VSALRVLPLVTSATEKMANDEELDRDQCSDRSSKFTRGVHTRAIFEVSRNK